MLGEELRRRPTDFNGDLAVVFVRRVVDRVESFLQVGDLHLSHNAGVVEDGAFCGDLDQRQRRLPKVDARAIVLRRRRIVVDRLGIRAPLRGGARPVGGALAEARIHLHGRCHVDQQAVVPVVGVCAGLPHDVFLATPIFAGAVGERVMSRESVRHLHRDGPNPVPVVVRHRVIPGESKVATPRQKHPFWRDGFVGHVHVERDEVRVGRRCLKPRGRRLERAPLLASAHKQKGARREVGGRQAVVVHLHRQDVGAGHEQARVQIHQVGRSSSVQHGFVPSVEDGVPCQDLTGLAGIAPGDFGAVEVGHKPVVVIDCEHGRGKVGRVLEVKHVTHVDAVRSRDDRRVVAIAVTEPRRALQPS